MTKTPKAPKSPKESDAAKIQAEELMRRKSAKGYMSTDLRGGSLLSDFMRGMKGTAGAY